MINSNLILSFFFFLVLFGSGSVYSEETTGQHEISKAEIKDFCGAKAFSGYYTVRDGKTIMRYYYVLVRAKHESKKLTLWLNGGMGCSAMQGLLQMHGPCLLHGEKLRENKYSWNNHTNVMYLDQPDSSGSSFLVEGSKGPRTAARVVVDLHEFLYRFLDDNTEFKGMDFYMTALSIGGRFTSTLAARILQKNKTSNKKLDLNLKGLAFNNGFLDAYEQHKGYPESGFRNRLNIKVLSRFNYMRIKRNLPNCLYRIYRCQTDDKYCMEAINYCNWLCEGSFYATGLDLYDIRQYCPASGCPPGRDALSDFMNKKENRDNLNIDARALNFTECNRTILDEFDTEEFRSSVKDINFLLNEGQNITSFCGEADYYVNCDGIDIFLNSLDWPGNKTYLSTGHVDWLVNGNLAGSRKTYGPLTSLIVYDAGEDIWYDQEEKAYAMFNTFIGEQNWNDFSQVP